MDIKHYVYMLRCSDGSLYTGYSTDPIRRLSEHNNSSKGSKYTRSRRPCVLVHLEIYDTKSEALKRECQIKKLNKKEKEGLVLDGFNRFRI